MKAFSMCVLAMALLTVAGCGGGGSKSTPPLPANYTIGGTVTGLLDTGLILQDSFGVNSKEYLPVSGSGNFTFVDTVTSGGAYNVTVLAQPVGQACTVINGSGTASTKDVTNVSVSCSRAYTIGGPVTGLTGTGLVLQDNGGINLTVSASATSYAFTFVGSIPSGGAPYSITVLSDPAGQACTVINASGTATTPNVTNVEVSCMNLAAVTYTIGGTATGLSGTGLILQDNLGSNSNDLLPVNENGSFTFVNPVASGGAYNVTMLTQPTGRNCVVTNGSGTATANVTNVSVSCVGEWTWMSGSSTVVSNGGQPGNYGTLGTPASTNIPGARNSAVSWSDASGILWIFGGDGYDSTGAYGYLNDLWTFNPASGEWTWMSGSSTIVNNSGQPGNYGTLGKAASTNTPGGRGYAVSWTDASGNFWLFGGFGDDVNGYEGYLNDLWTFNPASGEWTWMGGSSSVGSNGVYGTLGVAASANVPGGRSAAVSWTDASGNFWLFGGYGYDSTTGANKLFNDLWKYTPSTTGNTGEWTWMGGSNTVGSNEGQPGVYGTLGVAASTNIPGGRDCAMSWIDASGNLWLFGGYGDDSKGTYGNLNDLWKYTPSTTGNTGEWTWMGGSSTVGNNNGQLGVYGTLGVAASTNIPGARNGAVSWSDASGNAWIFGGEGFDSNGVFGYLNDLWKFDPALGTTGEWTWMGGSSTVGNNDGQLGVYGTLGTAASTNIPGGREFAMSWIDASGNLWLFGGDGYDSVGTQDEYLNDLWKYQP